jgi:hypothetical protein
VSEETAVGLAQSAYLTAQKTAVRSGDFEREDPPLAIGLGITAAIATSRQRRGSDHVWIALRTLHGIKTGHFIFEKGVGETARARQNELAELLALNALAQEIGAPQRSHNDFTSIAAERGTIDAEGLHLEARRKEVQPLREATLITAQGATTPLSSGAPGAFIVYPGSFRSFHCGHDLAAANAARVTGKTVVFEISANNADKAPIDTKEIARRVDQFYARHPVIVTPNAPLFVDKSRAYPEGTGFVIGYDTAERLLDPRFYKSPEHFNEALETFRARGNTFYVLGRRCGGSFKTILDLPGYQEHRDLFQQLMGQLDISASALMRVEGR